MDKKGFTIIDLLVRLVLIIIFIFLLIWLFPMPNLKPLNNQIFSDNVDRMKNVAKTYYTTERLPENINDFKKMTLKEMLDKKLILPLMDSNGNYCSEKDSYVQVTKLENEYVIKVYLSCSDTQDYIIEHFGCYDICSDTCKMLEETTTTTHGITTKYNGTTKKRTTLKTTTYLPTTSKTKYVYEYEFMKNVCNNVFDKYTCPSGYTQAGDKCIKNGSITKTVKAIEKTTYVVSTDTKDAKAVIDSKTEKVAANKSEKTVTSTIDANKSEKTSDKVVTSIQNVTADKKTSYDVKGAVGTEKITYASYSTVQNYDVITATKYATAYKWSYDYTLTSFNGAESYVKDSEKLELVDSWQEIVCDSCYATRTVYKYYHYVKEYTNFTYSCDAFPGYSLYDTNKCRKATTTNKGCPSGYTDTGSNCKKSTVTYSCSSYGSAYTLDSAKKTCTKTTTSYSCPSGTTKNSDGKTCAKQVYGCPSGTTEKSGKCVSTSYSCPSNTTDKTYTLSGSKCTVKTKKVEYTCPSGTTATSDEKYCVKTTSKTSYTCDSYPGYSLVVNKCTKTTRTPKTTYSCDKGVLSGTSCVITESTSDVQNATKDYKLSCNQEYKWSTKASISGWTYTGNKRILN